MGLSNVRVPRFEQNYFIEVALGNIPGVSHINKFGRNPDIDSGSGFGDIWDGGGTWVPPTTARLHDITSTSTDDDGNPVGTGARTLTIQGLDSAFAEQSETVTMDGTSIFQHEFKPGLNGETLDAKSIIKIQADTSANNTDLDAGFDLLIIDV